MRAKSTVLIMIALGCGLVASIGISQYMEHASGAARQATAETDQIFVAMAAIDIGEKLDAQNVKLEDWPRDRVPPGAIRQLEELVDRYPRQRLYAGEPILTAKLMDSQGEGGSVKIPEGYRVVSASVTMETAVSGLILPGDRVDVIAFLRKNSDVPRTTSRTILRNVRVFAVNSDMERSVDAQGNPTTAKTVSLLVKNSQVEPLMLALELGKLRLSLRRPNDTLDDESPGIATVDDILGRPAEVADDVSPSRPSTTGGSKNFLELLKNLNPPSQGPTEQDRAVARAESEQVWTMTVHTPQGSTQFQWPDAEPRPVGERSFSQPVSTERSAPAIAPPVQPEDESLPGNGESNSASQAE